MEKLIKAINSTKQFYTVENLDSPKKDGMLMPTKSERQENCKVIVECILSSSVKANTEYPGLLGITLETLLQACQDAEADVRIAAEDSLNRIIKSTDELLFGKVHLEFYKEIKRNGAGRSLRAALVRFSNMAHKIRPNKCRPYIVSLLPALIRICQRQDENIQECLATSLTKIFPHLGSFAAEGELQVFIDALLVNLSSTSATIRRTAAACIHEVVRNTRKKDAILATVVPKILTLITSGFSDINSILGAIVALRYLLPLIDKTPSDQMEKPRTGSFGSDKEPAGHHSNGDHIVKIFEVCCHSLCHADANIVTSSLETLQALLKLQSAANVVGPGNLKKTDLSEHLATLHGSSLKGAAALTLTSSSTPDRSREFPYQIRSMQQQISSDLPVSTSSVENETQDMSETPQDEDLELGKLEEEITSKLDSVVLSADDTEDTKETRDEPHESGNISVNGAPAKSFDEVDSSSKQTFSHGHNGTHDEFSESAPERSTTTSGHEENSGAPRAYVNGVSQLYMDNDPLTVVAKMLCERILKVGFENKKTDVRVSVKNLALSCLSHIIKLKPKVMFLPVLGCDSSLSSGHVLDVLSYKTFYDPQIRGTVVTLVSHFIRSALTESKNDYEDWLPDNLQVGARATTSVEHLVSVIWRGLADSSLVCIRASIAAVKVCINELLTSPFILLGLKLLTCLLDLKDTSYWLVKVDILELFSDVNFAQIIFVSEAMKNLAQTQTFLLINKLQQDLYQVGVDYLSDRDARVRRVASNLFVALVCSTGSFIDSRQCNMTTSQAAKLCQAFNAASAPAGVGVPGLKGEEKNLLKVHRGYEKMDENTLIGHTLSSLVTRITSLMSSSTSKHLTQGCIHALLSLCRSYPVSKFPSSYGCDFTRTVVAEDDEEASVSVEQNSGIMSTLLSMLDSSWLASEITTHGDVLLLAGNYIAGISFHGFEVVGPNPKIGEQESLLPQKGSSGTAEGINNWSSILDQTIASYMSRLFCHILKLISVFHHVIADALPTLPNKSVLQTLQTTPSITSSLKKKEKSDSKESVVSLEHTHKKTGSLTKVSDLKEDNDKEKSTKSSHNSPFSFAQSRVYMKVYELLVGAYETYKVTVEVDESDRFCSLLQAVLDVFSQILEVTTFDDIEKHTEEILLYLKTIFAVEPTLTVQAVQQVLKALFGTNLVSQIDLKDWVRPKPGLNVGKDPQQCQATLYHQVFHHPLNDLTMAIANASFHHYLQSENAPKAGTGWFGSIKKKVEKKLTMTAKRSKGDKTSVQNYIRLFETIVIKSLKNYTMSSSVPFQRNVLNLLAQLVQLRVNYCLLDSDQIFIGFLIKQFEAIEGGMVKNSDVLIPHMFFFLVLLSYEKHHSKSVMTMPKIIQLCDGIMASGCDVATHTIPALQPIVHDLFVLRGNMKHDNTSDLDTQREVIQSMLFRIIEHPEVLRMVTTILQYYRKENPEQWKRYSRQVTDVILPLMTHLKLNIWKYSEMSHLHSLFEALSPSALRPIDLVLNIFFLLPTDLWSVSFHSRWLMKTLSLLRVLLCHLKEDYILLRIKEMHIDPHVISCRRLSSLMRTRKDEFVTAEGVSQNDMSNPPLSPEEILSRTFVQLVGVTVERLVHEHFNPAQSREQASDLELLGHLLCEFLLTVTYICRSGSFKQVTKALHAALTDADDETGTFFPSSHICIGFHQLAQHQPVVTLLWSQLLTCVGFMELSIWGRLTGKYEKDQEVFTDKLLLNRGMVQRGSIIMLADYICQNQSEVELMSWLIVNHTSDVICLQSEPPIQDFISTIHRSQPGSGLFIESIRTLLSEEKKLKVAFKKQILYCLRGLHLDQSDALLVLLLNDWFVFSPMLAVSEFSSRIACDRVEMLLSKPHSGEKKDAIVQRLNSLQSEVDRCASVPRLARLRALIRRLLSALTGEPAPADPVPSDGIDVTDPDKAWYKNIASNFCLRSCKAYEIAQVLSVLDHSDIVDIMKSEGFAITHMDDCVAYGISEIVHPDNAPSQYSTDSTSALLKASLDTLVLKLDAFLDLLPPPPSTDFATHLDHSIFEMGRRSAVSGYWEKTFHIFDAKENQKLVLLLCKSLTRCLLWQRLIPHPFESLLKLDKKLLRLVISCYEFLVWSMLNGVVPTSQMMLTCMEAMQQVMQSPEAQTSFSSNDNLFHVLTIANSLHAFVLMFSDELQIKRDADIINNDESLSAYSIFNNNSFPVMVVMKACQVMQKFYDSETGVVPSVLLRPLEFALRQVLCHPFFNSLARVPTSLFKSEMKEPELEGLSKESPGEYLQDKDMLKEFVDRINTLGWISRMQFEETWTSLLGVLVSQPIGDGSQNASPVDENAIQISCLTISALTSLVVNSSMKPQGGQPTTGSFQMIPRVSSAKTPLTKVEHELHAIHCLIEQELRDVVFGSHVNQTFEYNQIAANCLSIADHNATPDVLRSLLTFNSERRERRPLYYGLGQRSVRSFQTMYGISPLDEDMGEVSSEDENPTTVSSSDESDETDGVPAHEKVTGTPPPRPKPVAQPQAVDAHSCVQFMIDLFSEWFHSASKASVTGASANSVPVFSLKLPRQFLCECLRSLLLISDFFTERQQFEWMFTSLNSLQMVQPCEDDIMLQYLILGMCKAGAVLGLGKRICEILTPILETAFMCALPSCHVFALQGALYVLECDLKEYMRPLLQLLSRFVCDRFKNINLLINFHSHQVLRHVIAVGFYLIENCSTFVPSSHSAIFIQGAISILSRSESTHVPDDLFVLLVKSLEGLVTSYSVSSVDCEAIAKFATDKFSSSSSLVRMLTTLKLTVTCMYYRIMRVSETNASEEEALEARLLSMERITLLFDRIRAGYPQEGRILVQVLPQLLETFFSTQDRMNKVIGEFVSNLHPFPDLIANVLHTVFQTLHNRGETDLIQSWVMLSLGNFTQRTPISAAIWCLTCIFVSASTNHWINSLLPVVLAELHSYPGDLDYQKFYVAASDFYDNLLEDLDRRTFHSIFKAVAEPGSPYQKLLDLIGSA